MKRWMLALLLGIAVALYGAAEIGTGIAHPRTPHPTIRGAE